MDCPTCGLVNPPQAQKCDCGFDFDAGKPADVPGWPIDLVWPQRVAAFWSTFWPAWVVFGGCVLVFATGSARTLLRDNRSLTAIVVNLAIFGLQALFTRRLVRKDYRSFRVYVVRPDGSHDRSPSLRETVLIGFWIFWPQVLLLLTGSSVVWLLGSKLSPETWKLINSLSIWARFLLVGPYGVDLALRMNYPAFRLQAYGLRRR